MKKIPKNTRVKKEVRSAYAHLGYKNHKDMATKADLVIEIDKTIKKKKLTQTKAAEILRISQPKLSELLSGCFKGYSVERLILFLNKLGQNVDIVVTSTPDNREASVSVYRDNGSNDTRSSVPMAAKGF